MVTASVGFHCPQCAHQGRQQVHTRHTMAAQRDPVVTKVLIGISVAAYVLVALAGGQLLRPGGDLFVDFALIGLGFDGTELVGVDQGEWYRLVTGGFLHANLLHLGMNMYVIWLLGSALEPALGRGRYLLVYMACELTGSLGVMLLDPNSLTIGASGAGFGLMGVLLVAQRSVGVDIWRSGIGGLVVLNLLITFAIPNISIGGHIGGLIGGLICGALLILLPRQVAPAERRGVLMIGTGLVVGLAVASVLLSIWASGQIPSVL